MISDVYQRLLKLFSLDVPMNKLIVRETMDSG